MVRRALPAVALLVLAAGLLAVWPFSVDDSYIVARYAERLATGQGYTFRAGPATDGVTGPLWLAPLAFAAWLGADAALVSKLLGGVCALGTLWVVLEGLLGRARGRWSGALAAIFLVTSVPFLTWATAGLETAAAGLAAAILARAAIGSRVRALGCVVGAAAIPWLRPELVPLAAALVAFAYVRAPRAGLTAAAGLAVSLALVALFRLALFGHLVPMAAAAKPPVLGHGASYVFGAAVRFSSVLLVIALGWGLGAAHARERGLIVALGVHALSVLLSGGDWMPGLRLFAPVAPVAALALGPLLARVALRTPGRALALSLLLFGARAVETVSEVREARAGGRDLARTAGELREALRDVRGAVVALDVGALAYGLPNDVIDLGGLTEPAVAYARGGHLAKEVDADWLAGLAPARIVLHSRERPRVDALGHVRWFAGFPVERRVLAFPWVQRDYRVVRLVEHARDYHYLVLAPRPNALSRVLSSGTGLVRDPPHPPDLRRLVGRGLLAP